MSEHLTHQGKQFPAKSTANIQVHSFLADIDQYARSMLTSQPFENNLVSGLMSKEARQEVVGQWQVDGVLKNSRIMSEILLNGEVQGAAASGAHPENDDWNSIWNDSDIIL